MKMTWRNVLVQVTPGCTLQLRIKPGWLHFGEVERMKLDRAKLVIELKNFRCLHQGTGRLWWDSLFWQLSCQRKNLSVPRQSQGRIVFWAGPKITVLSQ